MILFSQKLRHLGLVNFACTLTKIPTVFFFFHLERNWVSAGRRPRKSENGHRSERLHTHTHTHTHTEREREKPLSPSFACDKFACRNAGGAVPVTSPAGSVSVRWWVRFFFKHIFFRFFVSFSSPHFTRNQSRCFTKRNSDPYISPFVFVCLFVCFSLALATEDVANVQWNRLEFFEKKAIFVDFLFFCGCRLERRNLPASGPLYLRKESETKQREDHTSPQKNRRSFQPSHSSLSLSLSLSFFLSFSLSLPLRLLSVGRSLRVLRFRSG